MKILLRQATDGAKIVRVAYNWKQPLFEPAFKPFNINNITSDNKTKWLETNNLPLEGYYWETDDLSNNQEGPFSSESGAGLNYILTRGISAGWQHWFNVNKPDNSKKPRR